VVADDGVGMSETEQSHLLQPFYSTKGDLGNGLGLYIAKEIAERHHGRFLIEAKLGAGTTVRLRLPAPSQNVALLTKGHCAADKFSILCGFWQDSTAVWTCNQPFAKEEADPHILIARLVDR
jgi:Histidine kinase-, DNA gyrase B-, and HSP90-like ATPase